MIINLWYKKILIAVNTIKKKIKIFLNHILFTIDIYNSSRFANKPISDGREPSKLQLFNNLFW